MVQRIANSGGTQPPRASLVAVLLVAALGAVTAPSLTASAHADPVGPAAAGSPDYPGVYRGDVALLRNSNSTGPAQHQFAYGDPGDIPLVGDWNGNGTDTLGIRRANQFFLRNSNTPGPADIVFAYGRRGDTVVTGDWDGNGTDTVGIRRDNTYFLRNSLTTGPADIVIGYGNRTDTPVVGDWNGNGFDTFGVRRGNTYFLRNQLTSGPADIVIGYGNRTDTPVVGDWNGNGFDTFGVRRGNEYFLRNSLTSGPADVVFAYGNADDLPIVGRWGPVRSAPQPVGVPRLSVVPIADGLSIPWGLDVASDGTVLFTQRGGSIDVVLPGGVRRQLIADLDDLLVSGETGLMGLVLDPAFDDNRRFYTCQGHSGDIRVVAWTVNAAWTAATRVIDPLVSGLPLSSGRHGGCRLRFDTTRQLLIGTGDAAIGSNPQNLTSLGGKVLRVDPVTGQGSADNPFASSGNANTRRIYTYGHRNVQGVAIRPSDGQPFSVEHGPSRDDEINLLIPGGNYGWNPVPGYNEGVPMTDVAEFPSAIGAVWASGSPTLATSGATFLDGAAWQNWEGALAVASLKNATVRLFFFDSAGRLTGQVILPELAGTFGRLRTAELGPDGALYVTTANGTNDRILRVTPS